MTSPQAPKPNQISSNGEPNLPRQGKDFTFSNMRCALYSG
jgi:hypothetical protein